MPQQPAITNQTVSPIVPIDPQPIIEHGTEPVSIILAIAILLSTLLISTTGLVQVILILRQAKPSRQAVPPQVPCSVRSPSSNP